MFSCLTWIIANATKRRCTKRYGQSVIHQPFYGHHRPGVRAPTAHIPARVVHSGFRTDNPNRSMIFWTARLVHTRSLSIAFPVIQWAKIVLIVAARRCVTVHVHVSGCVTICQLWSRKMPFQKKEKIEWEGKCEGGRKIISALPLYLLCFFFLFLFRWNYKIILIC